MTTTELGVRVTVGSAAVIVVVALGATWVAGMRAGLGVLASGVLTIVNFAWLARGASGIAGRAARLTPVRPGGWALIVGARYLVMAAALGALLVTGWAQPLAVVIGLTVLPCVLIAVGLGADRAGTSRA